MAYGTIKVDTITFTDAGVDKSVTISGLVQNPTFSGNITVTGTVSGNTIRGQTVSGATITGGAAAFTTVTGGVATITSGVFALGSASNPSISFSGDANSGLYSPGADQVAISTNGTGRLFVDSSGRVGVITASPGVNLDVATSGNVSIRAQTTDTSGLNVGQLIASYTGGGGGTASSVSLRAGDSYSILVATTNTPLLFATNNTERMRLDSSGRLGLGTSSPTALLDVRGNALFNAEDAFWGFDAVTSPRLGFVKKSGSPPIIGVGSATAFSIAHSSGTDINTPSSQTYTTRFHITSGGNVGIGTTSPGLPLDVAGGIRSISGTIDARLQAGYSGAVGIGAQSNDAVLFIQNATERARIDSSGRLLVGASSARNFNNGVTTPRLQLEGLDVSQATFSLARNSANSGGPVIGYGKSRGTVAGSMTAVLQNDDLGRIQFQGADGTQLQQAAEISAHVDGTPGANDMPGRLVFSTTADGASSPTERMRITSAGNVGIGTTNPGYPLDIQGDSSGAGLRIRGGSGGLSAIQFTDNALSAQWGVINTTASSCNIEHTSVVRFSAGGSERARIDSSGRLLVGAPISYNSQGGRTPIIQFTGTDFSSANLGLNRWSADNQSFDIQFSKSRGAVGTHAVVSSNDGLGAIAFSGSDGSSFIPAALIFCNVDGTPGTNDMPGRLVFATTADGASSPTERMRIRADGMTAISGDFITGASATKAQIQAASVDGKMIDVTTGAGQLFSARNSTSSVNHFVFYNPNGAVGTIATSASATAYNTSSDYRLKENVVPLTGAIDRLNQLQVHRFNFIADPDKTVDGFIAHEAEAVVPECVTGTKDEVDDDGNPVYQGIDQSKLVPLLTAALQEALQKIEDLEGRLTAAGL
jgi:hypothetical protein